MKFASTVVTALILTGATLSAQAQIVKCVSKDGRVEFAQNCPPGTKQMDTGVSNKPAPAPAAAKSDAKNDGKGDGKSAAKDAPKDTAPKSLADRDAEFRKRQSEQKAAEEKTAKKSADDAERKQACQSAQSHLAALKTRQRMYRTDPKTGERVVYEEADYVSGQATAERSVASNCKE